MLGISGKVLPAIDTIPVGCFDPAADIEKRNRFWAGRPVCIVGYPFGEFGQMEKVVTGAAAALQPCVEEDIKKNYGQGKGVKGNVRWLKMVGSPAEELEGISDAPVLDLRSGTIAAVEHIYYPGRNIIIGTEIAQLIERMPGFKQLPAEIVELKPKRDPEPTCAPLTSVDSSRTPEGSHWRWLTPRSPAGGRCSSIQCIPPC